MPPLSAAAMLLIPKPISRQNRAGAPFQVLTRPQPPYTGGLSGNNKQYSYSPRVVGRPAHIQQGRDEPLLLQQLQDYCKQSAEPCSLWAEGSTVYAPTSITQQLA